MNGKTPGEGKRIKQTTSASLAWNGKARQTRSERFRALKDLVIPWSRMTALIEPQYPEGAGSRPVTCPHRMRPWASL